MKIVWTHGFWVLAGLCGVTLPALASGGFELRVYVDHSAQGVSPPPMRYATPPHRPVFPYGQPDFVYWPRPLPPSPQTRVRELERIFLADGYIDRAEWRILRRELERSGVPPRDSRRHLPWRD